MSISQELELIRREIGKKKFDAIEVYLQEMCPEENMKQYEKELRELDNKDFEKWLEDKQNLEKKYGVIWLSDVLYKREDWQKFEKWYKKYIRNKESKER